MTLQQAIKETGQLPTKAKSESTGIQLFCHQLTDDRWSAAYWEMRNDNQMSCLIIKLGKSEDDAKENLKKAILKK